MARPRCVVTFPNYCQGFDRLSWDAKLEKHKQFADANKTHAEAEHREDAEDSLDELEYESELRGCWLIRCDEITSQWKHEDLRLRVSIKGHKGLAVGSFDFGVLEGVMHFDQKLLRLPHSLLENPKDGASERGGSSKGDEKDAKEIEGDVEALKGQVQRLEERLDRTEHALQMTLDAFASETSFDKLRQRIRAHKERSEVDESERKRKRDDTIDEHQSVTKKPHGQEAHKRRLHFLWRGRETGERQIQLDYDRSNRGWIEFTDDDCMEFHGVIDADIMGKGVKWSGYKLGDKGAPVMRAWEDYDEKVYEDERIGRWR